MMLKDEGVISYPSTDIVQFFEKSSPYTFRKSQWVLDFTTFSFKPELSNQIGLKISFHSSTFWFD